MKRNNLPPLFFGNNYDGKIMSNTYSTNFNNSNKKKIILLHVTINGFNPNSARKKHYTKNDNNYKNTKGENDGYK